MFCRHAGSLASATLRVVASLFISAVNHMWEEAEVVLGLETRPDGEGGAGPVVEGVPLVQGWLGLL